MSDPIERDYRQIVHDLRARVLDGEDISAEEMHLIIDQIRIGRRAAAVPASRAKKGASTKGAKTTKSATSTPVDLHSLLDQEI